MFNLDRIHNDKTFSESVTLTRHYKDGEHGTVISLSFPLPNECPHCSKGISPNCLHIEVDNSGKNKIDQTREEWFAYAFFHCPYCGRAFYVTYLITDENARKGYSNIQLPQIIEIGPSQHKEVSFSDAIKSLSPMFCKIFNQANAAEEYHLDEIAGPGYRKSLEFLVKDFAIHNNTDQKEKIESITLVNCIKNYIDHSKIQTLAERSAWLGNDETHFVRKHEGRDIDDLKKLISTSVLYIDMELTVEDAESIPKK